MGNTHVKPHPRTRNKKQVHWKAAARPQKPGKPQLVSETEATPDLVTICWTLPANDGGSPISGYLVEHRRAGSPHWVRAAPLLVQVPEITISGLEPGWRYQFRVSAENAVGMSDPSELSEPITVTLQRSAVTAPRFTQELEDKVALENEKIEFVVHYLGQPAPKVCWFKDGFEIFSSRRIRILTESDRSVLTIHQTSLSDEGEIKCTATNRAGHVSTKAALTVEAPPSIRLPRQYEDGLLFEIGELIRLKVSVAGRPTPLVFWSHNGESVKNNDRYEIEYGDKSSVLKVNEAHRSDRGEYQIKAVNKLGEDAQSFLVTVTDKPSPPGRAKVVMALGRSVTLSWGSPVDDGGCKIGNYIVEYYRLGWNVWLKAATSRQLSTMLGDLIEGSEYKFRIKAESPYGVSDPSEETEVVFIPDPKRGILQPQPRGRSQPRDILEEVSTPVAARRKNKPRSQSSSRVEHGYREPDVISNIPNFSVPVRPERNKIKSPPKTPEASPVINRKKFEPQVNKKIFELSDRSSMARELSYGSPDIKMRRESDLSPSYLSSLSSSSEKSRTPSPTADEQANHKVYTVKIEPSTPPLPPPRPPPPSNHISRSPSPDVQKIKSPRENNENFTGSSEFMLVLYPDEHEKGQSDFDFDDISVPPPMSLSAPELGVEPPIFMGLKYSASSTELLHERAMMRFYQAAEAEEAELEKRRKTKEHKTQSMDVPKILINSKDDQDIVGLDRQHSLRRRMSAGGISQQHVLSAQRRHSLRSSGEMSGDILQPGLHKFSLTGDMKREIMMNRQRSASEEKEEEEFQNVRKRMASLGQSKLRKKKISIAEEEKWAEDYISSTDEDTESSEDERVPSSEEEKLFRERLSRRISYGDEEEIDTYHPRLQSEPFEILTKRKQPPDPNFIPKPILKKTDYEEQQQQLHQNKLIQSVYQPEVKAKTKTRSHSPIPQSMTNKQRSHSLVDGTADIKSVKSKFQPNLPIKSRPRSFSLLPQKELLSKELEIPEDLVLPQNINRVAPGFNISAVAKISGITAASVVIPETLLEKKRSEEEAKVVIDHYGDIVKNYGKRKKSNPQIFLDRDSLKKLAEDVETPQAIFEAPQPQAVDPAPIQNYHGNYTKSTEIVENKLRRDSLKTDPEPSIHQKVSPERKRERTLSKSPPKQVISRETSPRRSPSKSNLAMAPVRSENWSTLKSRKTSPPPMRKGGGRKTSPSPLARERRRKTSPSPLSKERPRKTSPSPSPKERVRKTSPSPLPKVRVRKTSESPMRRERKTSPSPLRIERSDLQPKSTPIAVPESLHKPMLREIMTQTSVGLESFDSDSWSRTSSPSGRTQKQEELMAIAEVKVRTAIDYVTDLAMFVVACWLYLFDNELLALPVLLVMVYRQLQAEVAKRMPKWIMRRFYKKKK